MSFSVLSSLSVWPDLAVEVPLRLWGAFKPVGNSLWRLPSELRQRVKIRWPRVYQWEHTRRWGDQVLDMLRRRVDVAVTSIPQPYKGTVQCEFEIDGRAHKVAFNISDYPDFVDEQCTHESLVTFKFQFRENGYGDQPVVPGGYLPGSRLLYPMLDYLRWSKDHFRPLFDVYGRFSMDFSPGVRGETLRRLRRADVFRTHVADYLVRYSRYLREVARSRVCVDLPGEGPLCFRLVEYLAIGSCIVAHPHGVALPGGLLDGVHIAYGHNGPDAIVERCERLLADATEQRAMTAASRAFFDQYLHRDQLSAYYINVALAAARAE